MDLMDTHDRVEEQRRHRRRFRHQLRLDLVPPHLDEDGVVNQHRQLINNHMGNLSFIRPEQAAGGGA